MPHYGPGVDSASNRNEYQEYFLGGKGGRCVWLTTLSLSCADCLEIWQPQPPGTFRAFSRPVMGLLFFFIFHCLDRLPLDDGNVRMSRTSAQNCQSNLRDIPQQRRSHLAMAQFKALLYYMRGLR